MTDSSVASTHQHPALAGFGPATREWFAASFAQPTAAQAGAWEAIGSGDDTLVIAPTGSGKTLAAFLAAIDRLTTNPPPEQAKHRCRVLYISPLKALAVDVQRNLRAPLTGIGHTAARLGLPLHDVQVGIRTGDTPAQQRRALATTPPDVLITTPESLFLLLTSAARESLAGVDTVILDEVHAIATTKRGAHLGLSLERLDHLLPQRAQRIGLSATVRPPENVARFLAGTPDGQRQVRIVNPAASKTFDLQVVVPVPDMGQLPGSVSSTGGTASPPAHAGPAAGNAPPQASLWPHVEARIAEHIAAHHSTLVFANSRRLAERLCTRLNEIAAQQHNLAQELALEQAASQHANEHPDGDDDQPGSAGLSDQDRDDLDDLDSAAPPASHPPARMPAEMMAQAGSHSGAPPVVARAHHGSVSKEQRASIEDALKAGQLPAVVATSSLELGIDMGAVDLVIQVEPPPSVASGLQRIGRAGHSVGAISQGVLFPKSRADLVPTAVVVERMRTGAIEHLDYPRTPLDVLAQQIVAMTAMDTWAVDELFALVRRAANYTSLTRPVFEAVLDMLAGRYPSDAFAELRPRVVWDRAEGTVSARPGTQRLAVTSGGTIPDRGMFGVFLAGSATPASSGAANSGAAGRAQPRRVGELDEEMVYESRVGDIFTLGTSTWRIEEITRDQVLVTPAPGQAAKLPFWKGDALGRPLELGRAIGQFVSQVSSLSPQQASARVREAGLDQWAAQNLLRYLDEQREATGHLPDDRTIVVERCRDEIGDWRIIIHSPFGAAVHAPWALAISARIQQQYGIDAAVMHADDGIVLRLPDAEDPLGGSFFDTLPETLPGGPEPGIADPQHEQPTPHTGLANNPAALLRFDPQDIEQIVTEQVANSALFASRFRECAARSLLLPRRNPGRRTPLWQQRQRSAQLLAVASQYPSFPVVLETMRECLADVYDVAGLRELLTQIANRSIRIVEVSTATPSPFAQALLFGYVAHYLYEGDSPLAERRASALALDPELLADLLGTGGEGLRDLLDADALAALEQQLQWLTPQRRISDAEALADALRVLGPLSEQQISDRGGTSTDVRALEAKRRLIAVTIAGQKRWAAVEDAGKLRDGLGIPLPLGVPDAFTEPVTGALRQLLARFARTHGPFTAAEAAEHFGLGVSVVTDALEALAAQAVVTAGQFRPAGNGLEWCDVEVVRRLKRASLAALRKEIEAVPAQVLAAFTPQWQQVQPVDLELWGSAGASGGRGAGAPAQWGQSPLPGPGHAGSGPTGSGRSRSGGKGLRGVDGVAAVVEQLQGAALPASDLESLILPSRVADYRPALLDELTSSGELMWVGAGSLPGDDGYLCLALESSAALLLPPPVQRDFSPLEQAVLAALPAGAAMFFPGLLAQVRAGTNAGNSEGQLASVNAKELAQALWDLVWSGWLTNDTLAPVRALRGGNATRGNRAARQPRRPVRLRYARTSGNFSRTDGGSAIPPSMVGRWSLAPPLELDPTRRGAALAEVMLERHGVLTRGAVLAEDHPGGFGAAYKVLAAFEESGHCRRGYLVEGLGASQFATAGAIDRLRATARQVQEASERNAATAAGLPAGGIGQLPPQWQVATPQGWSHGQPGGSGAGFNSGFAAGSGNGHAGEYGNSHGGSWGTDYTGGFPPGVGARTHHEPVYVLAATDPAQPFGAALPWPVLSGGPGDGGGQLSAKLGKLGQAVTSAETGGSNTGASAIDSNSNPSPARGGAGNAVSPATGHKPGRKAGAVVVLVGTELVLYLERGGKSMLAWSDDPALLRPALAGLAQSVHQRRIPSLNLERLNGAPTLSHPLAPHFEATGFTPTPQGLRLRG